jgi:diguanylate cyclase (GGDEF)-like protein/PAS domain S-box-containing protein
MEKRSFLSLYRKGSIALSLLLLGLGSSFGALNYWNLKKQFKDQQLASYTVLEGEFKGLIKRSSDRLQRLSLVFASLGKLDQLVAAPHGNEKAANLKDFFNSIRYELDVERIEIFDAQENSIWRWTSATSITIPDKRLREVLNRVGETEQPAAILNCQPVCSLHVFVPLLSAGNSVGILSLSQLITDLLLDFSTGSGTDVAILAPNPAAAEKVLSSWQLRIAALTNPQKFAPFLQQLAARYAEPDGIDTGKWLDWEDKKYTVHSAPLNDILEGETGNILFIADVSAAAQGLEQANRDALLLIGISLAIAEIILLSLLHAPLRRIKVLAATLPLLAFGSSREVAKRLKASALRKGWRDEVDILYSTSIALAHQIEEHQNELAAEKDFVQGLLDNAQVLILTQTRDGKIRSVNELTAQILGQTGEELQEIRFVDLIGVDEEESDVESLLEKLSSNLLHRLEHEATLQCSDGSTRHIVWVHTRLRREYDNGIAVLSIGLDATDRIQAESRMRWLANYDSLTGLANRARFREELERSFAEAERGGAAAALLLFDLDHFKDVNDTSGHAAGDALLCLLANKLRMRARKSDVLARLGGDEFAVLMPATDQSGAESLAQDINRLLTEQPFQFGERSYRISASIGIAMLPEHGRDVEELMANADAAMYQAKKAGRGRWHAFSPSGEERAQVNHRVYWRNVISRSLTERRLCFYYQPIIHATTGRIAYHEALLRLRMENGRIVLPNEYLGVILRSDLMNTIDLYVIEEALSVLDKNPDVRLSINLSAMALSNTDWAELLKRAVCSGTLVPDQLVLEITETAAIADLDSARRIMDELAEIGFEFALDDFGAGFASFHYLRHLPIKHVKIDHSFIGRLASDEGDRVFVSALTVLAHGYRQKVIAEGVENIETLIQLQKLGVDLLQGFYIGIPTPNLAPANSSIIDLSCRASELWTSSG